MPAQGNPHLVVRLDPVLKAGLEAYALAKGLSVSQLVRQVLMDFVREVASTQLYSTQEGVEYAPDRIKGLASVLEAQLYSSAVTRIQTHKQGWEAYDAALGVLKEAVRLAESEEAAKNVEVRINATHLASTATRIALAILSIYDRRQIEGLMNELKKTNDFMRALLKPHQKGTAVNTGTILRE